MRLQWLIFIAGILLVASGCSPPNIPGCVDYRALKTARGVNEHDVANKMDTRRLVDAYMCGANFIRPRDLSIQKLLADRGDEAAKEIVSRINENRGRDDYFSLLLALYQLPSSSNRKLMEADLGRRCESAGAAMQQCKILAQDIRKRERN